jgi:type I restriction enzyme, R subunit
LGQASSVCSHDANGATSPAKLPDPENESARQVMAEPTLRLIAHELVTVIKANVTVDWMHRDSARANIRRHVKRLLRKYGYPPDLQDAAVQNVLQQAEALSAEWAV